MATEENLPSHVEVFNPWMLMRRSYNNCSLTNQARLGIIAQTKVPLLLFQQHFTAVSTRQPQTSNRVIKTQRIKVPHPGLYSSLWQRWWNGKINDWWGTILSNSRSLPRRVSPRFSLIYRSSSLCEAAAEMVNYTEAGWERVATLANEGETQWHFISTLASLPFPLWVHSDPVLPAHLCPVTAPNTASHTHRVPFFNNILYQFPASTVQTCEGKKQRKRQS